jgi:hypothetical protein
MDDEQWADINVITGILKLYLRELQNPLLTFERYTSFIEAASKPYGYTIINSQTHFLLLSLLRAIHKHMMKFIDEHQIKTLF